MSKAAFFAVCIPSIAIGFLVGYLAAAPLRGGLISAMQPILTTPSSVVALFAAFVALIVGLASPFVAYRTGARQTKAAQTAANAAMLAAEGAGPRAVANVRLEWQRELRKTLSEYHSIIMSEQVDVADDRKLSFLGTQLDLLLNRNEKDQQALWEVSDDILKMYKAEKKAYKQTDWDAADARLVAAARKVLDERKIEAEINGLSGPPTS